MKKILIVNNNMQVGGIQKRLLNLLWAISDQYEVTLFLFSKMGLYADDLPDNVEIKTCTSLFRYLGISQGDCESYRDKVTRAILVAICRLFGRPLAIDVMCLSQRTLPESYDVAISYMQNGSSRSLYGGVNEFVLRKTKAKSYITYLHCDYSKCGADNAHNNRLYGQFDKVAACSEGCRESFLCVLPELESKCLVASNFHRIQEIRELASKEPVLYEGEGAHAVMVGRLAHEKAIDRAIRAIAFCAENKVPVTLDIVGDGPMGESLKTLTQELGVQGWVRFRGEHSNPYRYMKGADFLLVTSYYEAAPMVIDEARIIGIPTLTVRTTSSQEMVIDQKCGWVCDNTQEGLNRCLYEVVSNMTEVERFKEMLKATVQSNQVASEQFRALVGRV